MKRTFTFKSLLLIGALSLSAVTQAQYCMPDFNDGCTSGDDINTFTVSGENSTQLNSPNTGCSNLGAYEDFTSQSVTFSPGSTYSAFINTEYTDEGVQVFIDFNDDYTFSSTESVGGTNGIDDIGLNFNIVVPGNAQAGTHRMRVVLSFDYQYPSISPCPVYTSFYQYGEVHDYSVLISGTVGSGCDTSLTLSVNNITSSSANITWSAVTGATGYQYALTTSAVPPTSGTFTTTTNYNASALASNTTYYFHLRTDCGSSNYSAWKTVSFTTPAITTCTQPANVTVTNITATSAVLNWSATTGSIGYEYAITTVSTPPVSGTLVTTTTANISTLTPNTPYYAHVRNKCSNTSFSAWTTTQFSTIPTSVATANNTGFSLTAYPNPVNNMVTVKTDAPKADNAKLTITDMTGKMMQEAAVTGNSTAIDMSSLSAGVYFIKYSSDTNAQVIKITKQ